MNFTFKDIHVYKISHMLYDMYIYIYMCIYIYMYIYIYINYYICTIHIISLKINEISLINYH